MRDRCASGQRVPSYLANLLSLLSLSASRVAAAYLRAGNLLASVDYFGSSRTAPSSAAAFLASMHADRGTVVRYLDLVLFRPDMAQVVELWDAVGECNMEVKLARGKVVRFYQRMAAAIMAYGRSARGRLEPGDALVGRIPRTWGRRKKK